KPPEEIFEVDTKTLSSAIEDVDQEQKSENKESQKATDRKGGSRRETDRRRGNPAASAGLLGLIAGSGPSGKSSSIVDALVDKGLVADLNNIVGSGTNLKVTKGANKNDIDPLDQLIGTGGSGGIDDFLSALEDDVPQVTLTKKAKVDLVKPSKMTGSKEALGQRTEQSIMNVVLGRQGRITYLYEKYLKREPNLRGKISIEFTIAANGFVTSAQIIESTISHPDLERDLLNLIKRLKFDPIPSGNVTTIFPFQFSKVN
ncbi:MAG: TonB family protein, partial [bacterium]